MAGPTAPFNVLALNLALIMACPSPGSPPAWYHARHPRRPRPLGTRRGGPRRRTDAAVVAGLAEVRHHVEQPALAGRAGLFLADGAMFITLGSLGYIFQLAVNSPELSPVNLWSAAARLAVRNYFTAGPAVGRAYSGPCDPGRA